MELDYVDPESVPNFFTSSAETDKRLLIAKAIWDEKAKIETSGASQEYRLGWEEVQQIIREADAIINSSYQTLASQPPLPPLFSYDEADGETQRQNDNSSPQLPISDSQTPSQPISEPPLFEPPSTLLPNSEIPGHIMDIEGAVAQLPLLQNGSTQQAMLSHDSNPAGAASTSLPATAPLNGWLKDSAFYTNEEANELFQGP